ncbi:hypothetical protein BD410DRAFT_899986 [Rickenella mellea]|uniref:Uncharacterized protein n=1 Tax=Rickenella mellea TaxID=50990 RepID=A0A4Y7PXQ0_9AGAM|nr:hypothetical protein BD410DRAFT_899986 [Rickenella mellea]
MHGSTTQSDEYTHRLGGPQIVRVTSNVLEVLEKELRERRYEMDECSAHLRDLTRRTGGYHSVSTCTVFDYVAKVKQDGFAHIVDSDWTYLSSAQNWEASEATLNGLKTFIEHLKNDRRVAERMPQLYPLYLRHRTPLTKKDGDSISIVENRFYSALSHRIIAKNAVHCLSIAKDFAKQACHIVENIMYMRSDGQLQFIEASTKVRIAWLWLKLVSRVFPAMGSIDKPQAVERTWRNEVFRRMAGRHYSDVLSQACAKIESFYGQINKAHKPLSSNHDATDAAERDVMKIWQQYFTKLLDRRNPKYSERLPDIWTDPDFDRNLSPHSSSSHHHSSHPRQRRHGLLRESSFRTSSQDNVVPYTAGRKLAKRASLIVINQESDQHSSSHLTSSHHHSSHTRERRHSFTLAPTQNN